MQLLDRSPEARAIMECARRGGIPWSLASRMWRSSFDVAMEMGYDRWLGDQQQDRCPDCHTKYDEMYDTQTHRPLEHPHWDIEVWECRTCAEVRRLDARLGDNAAKQGIRHRVVPARLNIDDD